MHVTWHLEIEDNSVDSIPRIQFRLPGYRSSIWEVGNCSHLSGDRRRNRLNSILSLEASSPKAFLKPPAKLWTTHWNSQFIWFVLALISTSFCLLILGADELFIGPRLWYSTLLALVGNVVNHWKITIYHYS